MREEFRDENLQDMLSRITPAHAGRIMHKAMKRIKKRDHPRACGKNSRRYQSARYDVGSPPRMREELTTAAFASSVSGITPAHAGRIRNLSR